jgi:hypothetical protein
MRILTRSSASLVVGAAPRRSTSSLGVAMAKVSRRAVLLGFSLLTLCGLLLYSGRTVWGMHQFKQMCADLRPGTAVTDILPTLRKYGISDPLFEYALAHEGRHSNEGESTAWGTHIQAQLAIWNLNCVIVHDESFIRTSKLIGP